MKYMELSHSALEHAWGLTYPFSLPGVTLGDSIHSKISFEEDQVQIFVMDWSRCHLLLTAVVCHLMFLLGRRDSVFLNWAVFFFYNFIILSSQLIPMNCLLI